MQLIFTSQNNQLNEIQEIGGSLFLKQDGQVLPLINLNQKLKGRSRESLPTGDTSKTPVVVVSNGKNNYGLIVDEFLDSEEIVVKPLSRKLSAPQRASLKTLKNAMFSHYSQLRTPDILK